MNPILIEERIKAEALRLGFSLCGFTSPDPPNHFILYQNWLDEGNHGEMYYLHSKDHLEKRNDPLKLMPEVRSILSLAWLYTIDQTKPLKDEKKPLIAGFAAGEDYHKFLPNRLENLKEFISLELGGPHHARIFSDSAPILERELANRAGLGWIGKNSCLISPKIGSAFLLAELFSDYPFQPDLPFSEDRCGSCTQCIRACPTHCITPNRTIDSRQCISYLTIEKRNSIPIEYRTQVGNWLFGCDICQSVCPWNQHPLLIPGLNPKHFDFFEAGEFLTLSKEEFNIKFGHSALSRTKWRGLMRNTLIFLGNSGDRKAVSFIKRFLRSTVDPDLREQAVWSIRKLNHEEIRIAP
ncbi:MAG: tRNA epoxyqueuosine(34) reductase QueG [Chloroflexi bacterium]|nr:tRNA epoxyqueuosine(34) reductase QueG [Chloroflexota bacterium]